MRESYCSIDGITDQDEQVVNSSWEDDSDVSTGGAEGGEENRNDDQK